MLVRINLSSYSNFSLNVNIFQENGYHSGIYERTPDEPKPSVVQFSDKANGNVLINVSA